MPGSLGPNTRPCKETPAGQKEVNGNATTTTSKFFINAGYIGGAIMMIDADVQIGVKISFTKKQE